MKKPVKRRLLGFPRNRRERGVSKREKERNERQTNSSTISK